MEQDLAYSNCTSNNGAATSEGSVYLFALKNNSSWLGACMQLCR